MFRYSTVVCILVCGILVCGIRVFLKVLNGTKLILDDQKNHSGPSDVHYSLVTGQAFSFATQYKKPALVESLFLQTV